MSSLYTQCQDKNSYNWDREYRGKNYSPRHRKYLKNNRVHNNNNNNNNNQRTSSYKKRSPNRSPRHLKAKAAKHQKSSIKLPSAATPNLYFVIDQKRGIKNEENEKDQIDCNNNNNNDNDKILLPDLPDFQLDQEELSCFQDVEISVIHSKLDDQRLENGKILGQIHCDQDQFLNICQRYQHQNNLLKEEIIKYEQENESISEQVQEIQNILIQHKNENIIQNEEIRQSEIIKQHLWEAVNTNMQLLQQVNDLNKQIDSYHVLIAKKSQQLSILEKQKQQKRETENDQNDQNAQEKDKNKDKDKDRDDAISIATFNTNWFDGIGFESDLESKLDQNDIIIKSYADQLVSKNERYQEILTLLRNKVDELRDTRTRL